MSRQDLVVGNAYFMVTYPDTSMRVPIIITYIYLGTNPEHVDEDEPGPHHYFRYLPAFMNECEEEDGEVAAAWETVFPGLFSGWGESVPTTFSEKKLEGFHTL